MSKNSSRRTPKRRAGDYEVGYGRPPVATRFRVGGIGNPKGRPKRRKTVGQSIEAALMAPHKIEENGRVRTLSAQDIIILNLVRMAARGNARAIQTLFALRERYRDNPAVNVSMADLDREDQKLIEAELDKLAKARNDSTDEK